MNRPIHRTGSRWLLLLSLCVLVGVCSCNSTPPPPEFKPPDDQAMNQLRDRLDAMIDHTLHNRTLNTQTHNAWQIVHGILPYGRAFQIEHEGQKIGALDWIMSGGQLNGWQLRPGDVGVIAVVAPGSKAAQGHPDQWIGYLSQCGVTPDDKVVVQGKDYTIGDLVRQSEADIVPGQEACWTLMALSTYYPPNHEWTSRDGEKWTIERLANMEAGAPVVGEGASCGGTHRLYGLTVAVNRYIEQTHTPADKLTGGWKAANDRIQDCIKKAHDFQQPDGNFSANFFLRPGSSKEINDTLHATGHTLEWLSVALTDDQFKQPWVTAAADRTCKLLEDNRERDLDCGALYHGARGLILYRERRFGPRAESASATAGTSAAASTKTGAPAPGASTPDDGPPAPAGTNLTK